MLRQVVRAGVGKICMSKVRFQATQSRRLTASAVLRARQDKKEKDNKENKKQPGSDSTTDNKKTGGGGSGGGGDPKPPFQFEWSIELHSHHLLILAVSAGALFNIWWLVSSNRNTRPDKEISWQVFRDTLLGKGEVDRVKIITGNKRAAVKVYMKQTGYTYWFTASSLKSFEQGVASAEEALGVKPSDSLKIEYDDRIELSDMAPMLGWLLWIGVVLHSARMVTRADLPAMMNQKKEKFKPVMGSKTRFSDVAGMKEAKKEIQEFVEFLKHSDRFTNLGAKVPCGAILFGPPGTGKTLLAKAVAGEAGVPFYSVCGADFVEMYVGVGASRVRELFAAAKKHPRAIIYIDEVDAVGRKRGGSLFGGGSSERENTLNQLLVEMDGFKKEQGRVIVLASTNVQPSSLDDALLRPGRLDRQIYIDKPTIHEREEIFQTHLRGINLVPSNEFENTSVGESYGGVGSFQLEESDKQKEEYLKTIPKHQLILSTSTNSTSSYNNKGRTHYLKIRAAAAEAGETSTTPTPPTKDTDVKDIKTTIMKNNKEVSKKVSNRMAQLSPGFAGADIANICNEGALIAARKKKPFVDLDCMEKAIDRVIGGIEKRSRAMSDFEKRVVAYHEAGHAIVGWFLESCDPLMKISIVPRGSAALGYAQYLPSEMNMQTYNQLRDRMAMTLGGRASEWIHFSHLSTGAQDDLRKVTSMAYSAVSSFGMAREKLPDVVSYPAPGTSETNILKPYSEDISKTIDEEAKRIIDQSYQMAIDIINDKRSEIKLIAEHLLKHEIITRNDFINLIGPRPFKEEEVPDFETTDDNTETETTAKSAA